MKKLDLPHSKMVDRIGLGPEERELKLGTSFTNPRECAFHTLRYDFKPASVDTNKMATIDVGTNSQITVTFPPNLIFKGSAKSYHKQGIAIVNPETGEVTLEKLTCNITVKKIRSENQKMSAQKMSMIDQYISGQKPKKPTSSKSSKTHVSNNSNANNMNKSNSAKQGKKNNSEFMSSSSSSNNLLPLHSNSVKNSPNSQVRFPSGLSPSNASNASPSKTVLDDQAALDDWFNSLNAGRSNPVKQQDPVKKPPVKEELKFSSNDRMGELSDSSSSCGSSSSGDSSDSSSDSETNMQPKKKVCQNGRMNHGSPDPEDLLKEDLQLSESGSDSD